MPCFIPLSLERNEAGHFLCCFCPNIANHVENYSLMTILYGRTGNILKFILANATMNGNGNAD